MYAFVKQTVRPRKPPAARANAGTDDHEQEGVGGSSMASTSLNTSFADHDHTYSVEESPRSLKRKLDAVCQHAEATKKRLKYSIAKVQFISNK